MNEAPVFPIGNLTRDPELRFSPGGLAIAQFGIAVNHRKQNKQTQEWEDSTSFFDVTAFGKLAENVSESCQRGDRVIVSGRLEQQSWETNEGEKRSKVVVIADDVAPSLRWATAEVTRNEREERPAKRPARTASAGKPAKRVAPEPDEGFDDEPF